MKFNKKPLITITLLAFILGATFYLTTLPVDSRTVQSKILKVTEDPFDKIVEGDINGDGRIDVLDISSLVNYLRKFHAMDMNNDNKINIKDLNLLVKKIYGISTKVTIPWQKCSSLLM